MDARSFLNTCWRLSIIVLKFPAMNIQNTPSRFLIALSVASAVFAAGLAVPAFAQSYTWTGAAGDLWSDSANWSPSGPPVIGSTAEFNSAGAGHTTINWSGTASAKYITFDSSSCAAYTIGTPGDLLQLSWAGAITLNAGVTENQTISAGNVRMYNDIVGENTSYNFVNNSSASLTVTGNIYSNHGNTFDLFLKGTSTSINTLSGVIQDTLDSGPTQIWVSGGIWALTGLNNYSGGTVITGGSTVIANTIVNNGPEIVGQR